jgi:hypothetical protein
MARDAAEVGARYRLVVPTVLEDAEGLERHAAAQDQLTVPRESARRRSERRHGRA